MSKPSPNPKISITKLLKAGKQSTIQSTLFGGDKLLTANFVEKELECQICLSPLEVPVHLPCNSHSLCMECLTALFLTKKDEKGKFKDIHCPSCGIASGILKVPNAQALKINKELERIKTAYEKERIMWVDEKLALETKLNILSSAGTKSENSIIKFKQGGALNKEQVDLLAGILDDFNVHQLKEVDKIISETLEGNNSEEPPSTIKKKGRKSLLNDGKYYCKRINHLFIF